MILFTSETCKPCKELKEWLHKKEIEVTEVDVHKEYDMAKSLGITKVPTLAEAEAVGQPAVLHIGNEEIRPFMENYFGA